MPSTRGDCRKVYGKGKRILSDVSPPQDTFSAIGILTQPHSGTSLFDCTGPATTCWWWFYGTCVMGVRFALLITHTQKTTVKIAQEVLKRWFGWEINDCESSFFVVPNPIILPYGRETFEILQVPSLLSAFTLLQSRSNGSWWMVRW